MNDENEKDQKQHRGGRYAAGNSHNDASRRESAENRRKKKNHGNTVLTVICILLFCVLGLLIIGSAYVDTLLNRIKRPDEGSKTTLSSEDINQILNGTDAIDPTGTTAPVKHPDEVTWNTDPQDPLGGEHVINILLIGQDARAGQGVQRSDSMILCTLNKDKNTLTMTSFMRDLYVQIPGYKDNRLNASYAIGGMELLDACLLKNFGVEVDGNIEINFYGFMEMIDLMGGIDLELTQKEADYLNRRGNWDVDDDSAGTWNLKEGVNHMTGSQALAYSRIRDIGDDFGRTERQRTVLTELANMVKKLDLIQLNKLLYTVVDMISTDLSNAQITNLALEVFKMLDGLEIKTQRIPAWGAYENATISGMQVLVPDLEKCRQLLAEAMVS